MRLLASLAIADILCSVGFVMVIRAETDPMTCYIQAVLLQLATLVTILFGTCFALMTFLIVKFNMRIERGYILHLVCWGTGGVVALIPWFGDAYGPSGLWCWTKPTAADWLYRGVVFYFWVIACWVINIGLCVSSVREIVSTLREGSKYLVSEKDKADSQRVMRRIVRQTIFYPIINTFIWIPAITNRVQNDLEPNHPIFWLYFVHAFLVPLQGFADAVVVAWTTHLRRVYSEWWRDRMMKKARDDSLNSLMRTDFSVNMT